ncbi:glycosyltransferase [Candidatus Pacearchaeota archaeon]|nr:glycosyltransferase [Candidatus Pacearchaeota archaeon]
MKIIDIIIPAHNEEKIIESSLKYLYSYLKKIKNSRWRVIIGENGSTDNTFKLAKQLTKKFPNLYALHIDEASRDGVLKSLWARSNADVLAYMDADMSTHPKHINEMINAIFEGYDVAVGSRLHPKSKLKRSFIRKTMSKIYHLILLPIILPIGVHDAQCGFKAINQKVSKEIVHKLIKENGFFDTELLAVSHYKKYKVKEIPVEWNESERESTMNVYKNVPKFLRNIVKTRFKIINGYYD